MNASVFDCADCSGCDIKLPRKLRAISSRSRDTSQYADCAALHGVEYASCKAHIYNIFFSSVQFACPIVKEIPEECVQDNLEPHSELNGSFRNFPADRYNTTKDLDHIVPDRTFMVPSWTMKASRIKLPCSTSKRISSNSSCYFYPLFQYKKKELRFFILKGFFVLNIKCPESKLFDLI